MDQFDLCIIGGGVIGLSVARQLHWRLRDNSKPLRSVLLEQATAFGQGISSRNSEVIHAGIYYPAGSLKARLCVQGRQQLYQFCHDFNVPHRRTGKLIIAPQDRVAELLSLQENARQCGVENLLWLDQPRLASLEPQVRGGAALLSPDSGIIDSHHYMQTLLTQSEQLGLLFSPRSKVTKVARAKGGYVVHSSHGLQGEQEYQFFCRSLVNCAGLFAGLVAEKIEGLPSNAIPRMYPCKGSYFSYRGKSPFSHLVYPLPEANVKGLGVHGTLDMAGQLKFGPDAEYVEKFEYEVDAAKRQLFAQAIRQYFPQLDAERLEPAYSGIRPKLSGPGQGFADFLLQDDTVHGLPGLLQCFGIESPGLTASLALGDLVAEKLLGMLQ